MNGRRFHIRKPPFVSAAQAFVRTSADLEPDISENTEKSGKNTPVEPVKRAEPLFPKNPTDYSPRSPLRKQKNRPAHCESDETAVCGRCRPDSVARLPDKRPSAFGVRQHFTPRTSADVLRNGPIVGGTLATGAQAGDRGEQHQREMSLFIM